MLGSQVTVRLFVQHNIERSKVPAIDCSNLGREGVGRRVVKASHTSSHIGRPFCNMSILFAPCRDLKTFKKIAYFMSLFEFAC